MPRSLQPSLRGCTELAQHISELGITAGAGDSAPPHPADPHIHVHVHATCFIQEASREKGFLGNLNKYTGGSQTESIHQGTRAAEQPASPKDTGSLGRRRAVFQGEKPGGGRESRRQGLPAGGAGCQEGDAGERELDSAVRVSQAAAIPLPGGDSQQVLGRVPLSVSQGEGGSEGCREGKERKTSPVVKNSECILGSVLISAEAGGTLACPRCGEQTGHMQSIHRTCTVSITLGKHM